ncbi:protein huluwa [Diretmus argenteus]
MSSVDVRTPANLSGGFPATSFTLLVLLLIACVVVLLLFNCLFLGYKLLILSKNRKQREDTEEMTLHRVTRIADVPFTPNRDGGRIYVSVSEPVLSHPVTSSRTSSRDRILLSHPVTSSRDRITRFLRPDGATGTGSGSLRAPSTILATSSTRVHLPRRPHVFSTSRRRSEPLLSSESEVDTRANLVPPNSPTETQYVAHIGRSSSLELLTGVHVAEHLFDKVNLEYVSGPPETSCLNTSTVGPGLDSDFGASAGVSLRILSADSDGLSTGVLASALEWDYYDPCYVRQNNIPKHKHHRPVHTKQYWV